MANTQNQSASDEIAIDEKRKALKATHDAVQTKTFTRWWNIWLLNRGMQIDDLREDTRPGVAGMVLLELLTESKYRFVSAPKNRFEMMDNQNMFLDMLRKRGIRTVNVSAEDLCDGNLNLILGVVSPGPPRDTGFCVIDS